MKTLPATFILLVAAGIGSASRIRAAAPVDPAADQIALIRIQPCRDFVGATEGDPPLCPDFILTDADGTHVISIPGGEPPGIRPYARMVTRRRQGCVRERPRRAARPLHHEC